MPILVNPEGGEFTRISLVSMANAARRPRLAFGDTGDRGDGIRHGTGGFA